MQPSHENVVFAAAGLAALFLIFSTPSPAALLQQDPCEICAVSSPSVTHIEKNSNSKGELEEQLRLLLEELKQLEKEVEDKFRKDILPYLKREIEKLRNRLKEFSPGKEAPPPQRVQA
jgi:hypothetical protein